MLWSEVGGPGARPRLWLLRLWKLVTAGSAGLDGCATYRVLAFGWTSLMTSGLCWLLTGNTNRMCFRAYPSGPSSPRGGRRAPTHTGKEQVTLCSVLL